MKTCVKGNCVKENEQNQLILSLFVTPMHIIYAVCEKEKTRF